MSARSGDGSSRPGADPGGPGLTHVDSSGQARMVEVGAKEITRRQAIAEGWIQLSAPAFEAVTQGTLPKGDVLAVARIAGIAAAKRTPDLVPLCHPVPLTGVRVDVEPEAGNRVLARARVRANWRTGVEMEALVAVGAALLAVYDMVKAIDKGPQIGPIRLVEKRGGRSGTWTRRESLPEDT